MGDASRTRGTGLPRRVRCLGDRAPDRSAAVACSRAPAPQRSRTRLRPEHTLRPQLPLSQLVDRVAWWVQQWGISFSVCVCGDNHCGRAVHVLSPHGQCRPEESAITTGTGLVEWCWPSRSPDRRVSSSSPSKFLAKEKARIQDACFSSSSLLPLPGAALRRRRATQVGTLGLTFSNPLA